jgi:TolB protein
MISALSMPFWNLPLRFAMLKIARFFFLFAAIALHAQQELEVRLETKVPLKPIYLSRLHKSSAQTAGQNAEELRSVLAFDLANNGYSSIVPVREDGEQKINWADPGARVDAAFWKRERIPIVITLEETQNGLIAKVFNLDKSSTKSYPEIRLTRQSGGDRPAIHKLADAIQKDLFGAPGIASMRIIFSQRMKHNESAGHRWVSEIWTSDWDGANAKRLTFANGYCMSPGFLPHSIMNQGYFFAATDRGQSKIYRGSLLDSQTDVWIHLRGNQLLPAVSKDGSKIAFISDAAGRPDLFIQELDAKGKENSKPYQLYSAPNATAASPTFSPDGRKIAFVSDKGGTPRIYVMEILDPRTVRKPELLLITRTNRENTSPSWSPDGKKLAYSARADGVRQIWIYDFTTQQEWQLTTGAENKENAVWAPDSLHLIYNTETHDVSELYLINLHQQEPIRINLGFGQKRFASWEQK